MKVMTAQKLKWIEAAVYGDIPTGAVIVDFTALEIPVKQFD